MNTLQFTLPGVPVKRPALAVTLAPEMIHLSELPERVRECALDRAAASIREALSVHLASGVEVHYAKDDRDILTIIGFLPDRRQPGQIIRPDTESYFHTVTGRTEP